MRGMRLRSTPMHVGRVPESFARGLSYPHTKELGD